MWGCRRVGVSAWSLGSRGAGLSVGVIAVGEVGEEGEGGADEAEAEENALADFAEEDGFVHGLLPSMTEWCYSLFVIRYLSLVICWRLTLGGVWWVSRKGRGSFPGRP